MIGLVSLKRTAFNSTSFSNLICIEHNKTDYKNMQPSKKKKLQTFIQRKSDTFLRGSEFLVLQKSLRNDELYF